MLFEKFYDAGAEAYDRNFGHVSREFVPRLLAAARVEPGQRVLDIATGTGIAAEIAAEAVGPSGHVVAADISRPMLDRARERLGRLANTSVSHEDGQALSLPDGSFDAVLCSMALMLFPDPSRGLSEFHRVLREGGRAAVSVNTTPDRSFITRINVAIGRHVPSRARAAAHYFSLGDPAHLRGLFETAGFREIEIASEVRRYGFPSFEAYFDSVERGSGVTGTEYAALPEDIRRAVREDVRRELEGDAGSCGPIEVPVEILFGSGHR